MDSPDSEQPPVQMVMAPFRYGAMKPPPALSGANCPVIILLQQGGWSIQAEFTQNDALDLARRIRTAAKEARGGIVTAHAPLLGANGAPISMPTAATDDDDLDDLEPAFENEATA